MDEAILELELLEGRIHFLAGTQGLIEYQGSLQQYTPQQTADRIAIFVDQAGSSVAKIAPSISRKSVRKALKKLIAKPGIVCQDALAKGV
jgi:hypothetical protein